MKTLDVLLAGALGLALVAVLVSPKSKLATWITGTSTGLGAWIKSVTGGK